MTQEALKLAVQLRETASGYWTEHEIPIIEKLIQLLAQPEQEPVNYEKLAALGWQSIECPFCGSAGAQAFPQRTWVGLTDEEVRQICVNEWGGYEQCRAIEAKLKEKNT